MARKINIEDVGLEKRFYPIYDTHGTFAEGGEDGHNQRLRQDHDGYEPWLPNGIDYEERWGNIVNYLSQPDPDGNLCKRCKQIMINALEIEED